MVCPSTNNLVFGIKPTMGLLSQDGIIPIGHSQDTAGPMARTVTDLAILLNVMRTPFGPVAGQCTAARLHGPKKPHVFTGKAHLPHGRLFL